MDTEKKIEKSEPMVAGLNSEPSLKLSLQDMASGKDGIPSNSTSSISPGDAMFSVKGEPDKQSVADQDVQQQPMSSYNYFYPGYNGTVGQMDDLSYANAGDGSYPVTQSDNGSYLYYMPGYHSYATGNYMGVDGQQPCYSPSGYLQHPVTYGSEAMPCYTWDSKYVRDVANGTGAVHRKSRSAQNTNGSVKSYSNNPVKASSKFSTVPLDSKSRQSTASNFSKPILQTEPVKSLKVGSGFQSPGLMKGFPPVGNFSPYTNQNHGFYAHGGPVNYRPNARVWTGGNRFKFREKSNRNGDCEASMELTCGPRAHSGSNITNSPVEVKQQGVSSRKDQYNREDFQTDYETARFFVIKSYSEDDVHKCIKYDVWSSTPNGNKKLDAVFHDAEAKASEAGTKCPVFLFFSVNGSGQFVGVAEMIGKVDFNKDMDFWQLDKWNGFFPVKWHIVKDIPNSRLRHIILENNDNKPVTFTRDTQEIGLKQGLEMLKIFKSYSEKTSVLDDLEFYESREKMLKAKRSSKLVPQTEMHQTIEIPSKQKHMIGGETISAEDSAKEISSLDPPTSLIDLTNNLSLN